MDGSNPRRLRGLGRARVISRLRSPSPERSLLTQHVSFQSGGTTSSSSSPMEFVQSLGRMSVKDATVTPLATTGFPRGNIQRGILHNPHGSDECDPRGGDYVHSIEEGFDKSGKKGHPINIRANYIRLKSIPSWSLHQYFVEFSGQEDRTNIRKKLFRKALAKHNLETSYMFDSGAQLFIAKRLEEAGIPLQMKSKLEKEDDPEVTISITYIKIVEPGAPIHIQLHNILIRKCLFGLDLQLMGRNFFDPLAAIKLPQQKLELWPGYVTSIRTHENDILLCVEVIHKVLRTDTIIQIIKEIERNVRGDDRARKAAILADLKDTVVMTTHNKTTYHVDDINFELTPMSTFDRKGEPVSYADYYKEKYQLVIKDLKQPLIMSKIRKRDQHMGIPTDKQGGSYVEETVLLIPELCQSTGLTDAIRSDMRLMKELAKYLHQGPQERVNEIKKFMQRIKDNAGIQKDFDNWGLHFEGDFVELQGRVMGSEKILFATGEQPCDQKGDFTMAFRSKQMLSAVQMDNWVLLVPQRDAGGVDNFVRTMIRVAGPLSMRIVNPTQIINLPDIRPATYLRTLEDAIGKHPDLQMIFVILPNNKLDLYAQVKKRLAVEQGIPSQCFLAKNVISKGLMSIATKVVVQMNAKLGGEPWSVKLPLKNTMFVGFDVHKGGKGSKGGAIGAMVATFSPNFTRYYSTTARCNNRGDDMSKNMQVNIRKCIRAYKEANSGMLPEKIIMYRDGVGDGQLKIIYDTELKAIKEELAHIYQGQQKEYGLTYIVVSKKINTRLMEIKGNNSLDNPPPGTIVDSVVTLPERFDFFLISCGAPQGTVSPCSYNVLYNGTHLEANKIQMITYKMCHMYFNWSGTIAVSAPCQYAHKLAFLTGMAYDGQANEKLSKLLHFL